MGGSDPGSDDRNDAGLWRLKGRTSRGRSRPWRFFLASVLHAWLPLIAPSYLLLPADGPRRQWTVYRIMAFAATIRDIPRFFHAGVFLLSSPKNS